MIEHIRESSPEVVALLEAKNVSESDLNILMKACPDYRFKTLKGDMLVGTKDEIVAMSYKTDVDVYRYNYLKIQGKQKTISFMIADVYVYPLHNKEAALNVIYDAVKKYEVEILVGDFNTPNESIFFNDLKTDFNSFHPDSLGLSYTWPVPVPLIEIDQIWIAKSFQPIKLTKHSLNASDHKLLIAEYY